MDQPLAFGGEPPTPVLPYSPSKRAAAITLMALVCVFAISIIYNPPVGNYPTICGFKNLTGLPCPACGLAHSFCSLGKLHLSSAVDYNLLGPVLFLYGLLLFARSVFVLVNRDKIAYQMDRVVAANRTIRLLVLSFVVYGVIRIVYLVASGSVVMKDTPLGQILQALFS